MKPRNKSTNQITAHSHLLLFPPLVPASLLSASNFSKSTSLNLESSVLFEACARNSSFKKPNSFVNVLTFSSNTEFSFRNWFTLLNVSCVFCFDFTLLRFTAKLFLSRFRLYSSESQSDSGPSLLRLLPRFAGIIPYEGAKNGIYAVKMTQVSKIWQLSEQVHKHTKSITTCTHQSNYC